MQNPFAVTAHWDVGFEEARLQSWAEQLRNQLRAPRVSLGLVFMTPRFFPEAVQVLEILRVHAQIPLLVGCSSASVIVGDQEIEETAGLAVGLFALPGAELQALHFTQAQTEEANGPGYWHLETGLHPEQTNGWLVFADPFHLDAESWLRGWNEAYAPMPVLGGLASGDHSEQVTQVYLNGEVFEEGGVAVSFSGDTKLSGVISQGCTPVGNTWTITRVERNLIHEIGNRPAYEVLVETFHELPAVATSSGRTRGRARLLWAHFRASVKRFNFSAGTPRPPPKTWWHCCRARKNDSLAPRFMAGACAVATGEATAFSANRTTTLP